MCGGVTMVDDTFIENTLINYKVYTDYYLSLAYRAIYIIKMQEFNC